MSHLWLLQSRVPGPGRHHVLNQMLTKNSCCMWQEFFFAVKKQPHKVGLPVSRNFINVSGGMGKEGHFSFL